MALHDNDVKTPLEDDTWVSDPSPKRKAKSKKNTKRWCRGKVGVEHTPEIVKDKQFEGLFDLWGRPEDFVCGVRESPRGGVRVCYHKTVCSKCGKVLEDTSQFCPTLDG